MHSLFVKERNDALAAWFKTGRFLLWLVLFFSLAITSHLWQIERDTYARHLQDNFDFLVRENGMRVEQRLLTYEQNRYCVEYRACLQLPSA